MSFNGLYLYLEEPQYRVSDSEKLGMVSAHVVRDDIVANEEESKSAGEGVLMFLNCRLFNLSMTEEPATYYYSYQNDDISLFLWISGKCHFQKHEASFLKSSNTTHPLNSTSGQ